MHRWPQRETTNNSMQRQRKRRRRKSQRHIDIYRRGIISTSLRRALECCLEPRINSGRRWSVPTIAETTARLTGGRVKQFSLRYWINGGHRAPAWFVAVLRGELERQIRHRQEILAQLAEYRPQDRAAWRAKMAAKARAEMLAGVGAIGKRRKAREEAMRRAEADARAALGQAENNASATSPPGDNRPSENNGPIGSPPVRYPG